MQREIAIAIFIVTKEMIWNKWEPLSISLCFNEFAFAQFQDKFPTFQLMVACSIEKELFNENEAEEITETMVRFMVKSSSIVSKKYSKHELEKWN